MPAIDRLERKYLGCISVFGCRIVDSDEKEAAAAGGDSEELCIEDSPFNVHRPAVCQGVENNSEIVSVV